MIIRRARGTAVEHVAALPKDAAGKRTKGAAAFAAVKPKQTRPNPRPSRRELDDASEALAAADVRDNDDLAEVERRIEKLRCERDAMVQKHKNDRAGLEAAVTKRKLTTMRRRESGEASLRRFRELQD